MNSKSNVIICENRGYKYTHTLQGKLWLVVRLYARIDAIPVNQFDRLFTPSQSTSFWPIGNINISVQIPKLRGRKRELLKQYKKKPELKN